MERTPKSMRCHIGLFGRRNVGKSSLLNALTRQNVSIVSQHAGTTTDPVEKPMELLPLGPILFIDTAGIDDSGALGEMRIAKTRQAIERTDIAVLVTESHLFGEFENKLLENFKKYNIPVIIVFNKTDKNPSYKLVLKELKINHKIVETSTILKTGLDELRKAIFEAAPDDIINNPPLISDLVSPGDTVILVVPIDKEAPKGRIILPQVRTIRDLLDHNALSVVVKENELKKAINMLKVTPRLVVTDSQAFQKVAQDTPEHILMTSFSTLFARHQGDLQEMVRGAVKIENLQPGDRVLIAESCTHHPIGDDIGRVKIPNWLTQYTGGKLNIDVYQGRDFPQNLSDYNLVIHCGACMFNRKLVLTRIHQCREAGVPITNYGLAIAYSLGIFERALRPFPGALKIFENEKMEVI